MRVLWISPTPSLFDEKKYGGWIGSLERIISNAADIELGIAFEYKGKSQCVRQNNVFYYPINVSNSLNAKIIERFKVNYRWEKIRLELLYIIKSFKPDIIQCFGSEWPYGLIVNDIDVPVVIHMQGFLNIYNESADIAISKLERLLFSQNKIRTAVSILTGKRKKKDSLNKEIEIMKSASFFLGRTNWDKEIVNHYNSKSHYFYCSEALRPEIYDSKKKWEFNRCKANSIVTITQASELKGNEMILRTAKILKESFNIDFTWNVAGRLESFIMAERKTGINHLKYNINLVGMIPATEVERMLRESMLYVHPAIIDNSPNSLCEAQVVGCPVIAANVGGISSLVEDFHTGFLYPYNEPFKLAFLIIKLLNNKEILEDISRNEIKGATERHNPENIKRDLLNIYSYIVYGGD